MTSVKERERKHKKPKRSSSGDYTPRIGLSGTCYIQREEDWYPPDCSLVDPNIEKRRATRRELRGHCERLTCPVCARYGLQGPIKSVQKTHAMWSLPRYFLTCNFKLVRRSQLSEAVITRVVICAERVVRYLKAHKGIMAYFVKLEIAQGKNESGEQTVLFHLHSLVMLEEDCSVEMLLAAMPGGIVDCHLEYVRDKKQETYARKSYISNLSKNKRKWNPNFRCHVISLLNDWQKATGRKHLFWFGGQYDGRARRRAQDAMVILDDLERLRLLPGFYAKARYLYESRKLLKPFVQKWRRYHKYHNDVTLERDDRALRESVKRERRKGQVSSAGKMKVRTGKRVKKDAPQFTERLRRIRNRDCVR